MKSRTYKAMLGTLELTVCTRLSWKLERSSCLCLLRAGIKSICFYFSVFCLWQIPLCRPGQTGYILYSIQVLSDVFGVVFLQQTGRGQKTCMGEFSPLTLAPRDWTQHTEFASSNICIFFPFWNWCVWNCVWVGIILSRPEWYLTSSLICNTVRSYSYIYQLNSILCGYILIKFKLLDFPNKVFRHSSLFFNNTMCWNKNRVRYSLFYDRFSHVWPLWSVITPEQMKVLCAGCLHVCWGTLPLLHPTPCCIVT